MKCKNKYTDSEKYARYKRGYQKRYRKNTNAVVYPRRSYTLKEDELILLQEIPDRELAQKLKRSVCAIQIRRARLRKVEEE